MKRSLAGFGLVSVARTTSRGITAGLLTAAVAAVPVSSARAGEIYSFGLNQFGEIGDGTSGTAANPAANSRPAPVAVIGMTSGNTAIAGGGAHSLAVKDGALFTWGFRTLGQLGDGGTVGGANTGVPIAQPAIVLTSGVTAVAGGLYHSAALANGGVYTFGFNSSGQLANGTAIFGGSSTPAIVPGLDSGVTAIAAGRETVLAIKGGAAYAMGNAFYGQTGSGGAVGSTAPNVTTPTLVVGLESGVTAIAGGGYHSLAIKNGAALAFGSNQYGQLGNNGTTGTTTLDALYSTPQAVVGLSSGVTDISAGNNFSLALKSGVVYAWGENTVGQLGNGTNTDSPVPLAVSGLGTIVDVEAATTSAYALDADGSLWSWGNNTYGQLGTGATDGLAKSTPQHVFAQTGYRFTDVKAASNTSHVLVIESALPVYYTGLANGNLNSVANLATTVAGTTPAPINIVESTDVFFGTTTATAGTLSNATVASAIQANTLTFGTGTSATSAVTINGGAAITLNADKNTYAAGTGIVVQSGSAAVTINAPLALARSQSWTTNSASAFTVNGSVALGAGRLTLAGTGSTALAGVVSGTGGLTKSGTGTVTLTGANTYTGTTAVALGTLRANPAASTILLTGAGGVDLQGGRLVLDYAGGTTPVAQVKAILDAGYAGNFAAGQIRGTTLAAGRTLGYGDNGVDSVTVRVTLPGDADLDGDVDFNDFLSLQTNFGSTGTRFDQGNFNYDASTDFNDFLALQTNFGQSVGGGAVAFTGEEVAAITAFGLTAAVPEPASLALLGLAAAAGLRRTRRQKVCPASDAFVG